MTWERDPHFGPSLIYRTDGPSLSYADYKEILSEEYGYNFVAFPERINTPAGPMLKVDVQISGYINGLSFNTETTFYPRDVRDYRLPLDLFWNSVMTNLQFSFCGQA